MAFSGRSCRQQLAHSDQVEGPQGDVGELLDFPPARQPRASEAAELFEPAEDLLVEFPLPLAVFERLLADATLIEPPRPRPVSLDARNIEFLPALARGVRLDAAFLEGQHKVLRVIAFVRAQRRRLDSQTPFHPVEHPQAARAFGVAVGLPQGPRDGIHLAADSRRPDA